MNQEQKEYLLSLARESIRAKLEKRRHAPEPPGDSELIRECGAFVTLKTNGQLRGCIGNIRAHAPLYETICEMAVAAATQDPRFSPMKADELGSAHIEISALTPFEKITSADEIEVGRDGLFIKHGYNSGLLLPQVATEYGWDKYTFLEQTCRKASLPAEAWKDPEAEIYRFSAEVFGEREDA